MIRVAGRRVERWVQMLPLEIPDAVRYLQGRLRRAGVEKALVKAGARAGDDVVIGDTVFEFDPDVEDLPEEERLAILAADEDDEVDADDRRRTTSEPLPAPDLAVVKVGLVQPAG